MRAARLQDHMLCLVAPIVPGRRAVDVANELQTRHAELDALFRAHGGVHFATFTILPPSPAGTSDPTGESLALMLAVDAGVEPRETLERLAGLAPATLQAIYGVAGQKQLLGVLLDPGNLQKLSGGFVGARDRSVSQVIAEGELAKHLRSTAARRQPAVRADASRLVSELTEETLADPKFSWARQPAPQRELREAVTPTWWRLGSTARWLVGAAGLALLVAALALTGFVNRLVVAVLNDRFVQLDYLPSAEVIFSEGGQLGMALRIIAAVVLLVNGVMIILVRLRAVPLVALELVLLVSLLAALVLAPILASLPLTNAGATGETEFNVFQVHLIYGLWVLLGLAILFGLVGGCVLFAWSVVPPYLSGWWLAVASSVGFAIGLVVLHFVLAGLVILAHRFEVLGGQWYQECHPWGIQPIDRIAAVVVGVAAVVFAGYLLLRWLLGVLSDEVELLNTSLFKRKRSTEHRLHQVAPSIIKCEADWVGRPGVMISLTEVRQPYCFHGCMSRFFLWAVSSLGWQYFSEGRLGTIRDIQYAHWHLVDKGRRLLFCSNFDGDFGSYLDDFILPQVPALNGFWRWTRLGTRPGLSLGGPRFDAAPTCDRAFPRTRLLLFAGCRREQEFKAYARESMLPFQYHFAAYDYSLPDILRSTRLRDALSAPRTPEGDALIMRALEA